MNTPTRSDTNAPLQQMSSSSSFLSRGPRIVSTGVQITPMQVWLKWDDAASLPPLPPSPPVTISVARPIKKARLPGGQTTLTQLVNDDSPSSSPESVLSDFVPTDVTLETIGAIRIPQIVENIILVALLQEIHENTIVLMEQITQAYSWFRNPAFGQRTWITEDLPQAITAVQECPVIVSVMGLCDMKRFLPSISSVNTYVLLKQLSVHHGYNILLDLDQEAVNVVFKLQHEKNNFGTNVFSHGTGEMVNDDIFSLYD